MVALALSALVLSLSAGAQPGSGLTKVPVLKETAEAIYPPAALRDRIGGDVVLELDIDVSGHVKDTLVVSSSTVAENPEAVRTSTVEYSVDFLRAAKKAAKALIFEPAEADGKPVPVRITYAIHFKLPPKPVPFAARTSSTSTSTVGEPAPEGPGIENFVGVVRERGSRERLSGVVVTVYRGEGGKEGGFEAITDRQGKFKFVDLPDGEWKVIAETEGYYPFRTEETMKSGEVVEVTYYVEKGSYNKYDVLVEAERPKKEVNRRYLSIQEIVSVPGTLRDPILGVVDSQPGVGRPPAGSGLILVRGSGPQDSALFIDGVDIPLIFHFGALRSVVPAEVVDGLDFYPGNYPIQYGGATGGVIDLHTKRLSPNQLHGSLDVSLLDAALYLETPVADNAWIAVGGRRSYADVILKAVIPSDASVSFNTLPRYYDYQVLARWKPSADHDLRLFFIGSDDKVELLFKNPADIDVQLQSGSLSGATNFQRAALEYTFKPTAQFSNLARVAIGQDTISARFFGGQFKFDIGSKTIQGRDLATYNVNDKLALSAGIDTQYYLNDVSIIAPRPPKEGDATFNMNLNDTLTTNLNNAVVFYFAPFVESEIRVIDHLTLVPGLRMDYFQPVNKVSVDPRLVARYQIDDEWTLKGGIGLFHQAPQPDETDASFGNPDLGLEQAIHYSVGAEWRPEKWLSFDATLFYKDLSNLVSRTDATTVRDGTTVPLVYDNNGVGRVYGAELYIKHEFAHNLRGWLAYTLMRSERKDSGATDYRLFQYDQTHILNIIANYTFPENWELGIRFRLISGNPSTPYVGGVYLSDFDRFSPIPGPVYSERLPLFHQLDIRIDKRWIWDLWSLDAYFNLVNSYNHGNVEAIVYNFNYTQMKNQTGFPIFPIIGLRVEL